MSTAAFSESRPESPPQSAGKRTQDVSLPAPSLDRITSDQDSYNDQPDERPSLSVPSQTRKSITPESSYSQVQEEVDEEESNSKFRSEQSQQSQTEAINPETTQQEESESRTEHFQQSGIEAPLPDLRLQEENNESGDEQHQQTKVNLPKASLQEETDAEGGTESHQQQTGAIPPEALAQEETYNETRIEQYQQQTETIHIEATLYEENDSERMIERYLQDDTDTIRPEAPLQGENDRASNSENATEQYQQNQTEAVLPEASLREENGNESDSGSDSGSTVERDQQQERDAIPQASPEEENDSESWTEKSQQNQTEAFTPEVPLHDHGTIVEPLKPLAYQDRSASLGLSEAEQFDDRENPQLTAVEANIISSQSPPDYQPKVPPSKVREVLECVEIPIMSRSPSVSRLRKQSKGATHDLANATAARKPKERETEPIFTVYDSEQDSSEDSSPSGSVSPWEIGNARQFDKNKGTLEDNLPHGYVALSRLLSDSHLNSRETPDTSSSVLLPLDSPPERLTLNDNGTEEATHLDRLRAIWSQRSAAWSPQTQGTNVGTIPLSYSPDFVFGTAMPLPNKR